MIGCCLMFKRLLTLSACLAVVVCTGTVAFAEVADNKALESVTALSRRGKHLEAIAQYRNLAEDQITLAEKIAAAHSAWAAGIIDLSRDLWNGILAQREFKGIERQRAVLSLAILELQENNPERARFLAEQSLSEVQTSDLKTQFLLLIGESLTEQGAHSKAENYYQEAVTTSNDVIRSEAKFLYGKNQLALGRIDSARKAFTEVETASDNAPEALFNLIKIDLDQGQYNGVLTWIKEGREEFPMQFEDSWVRYAYIVALANTKQLTKCAEEVSNFKTRYSDQNPWFILAQSEYEGRELATELNRLSGKSAPEMDVAELALADLTTPQVTTKKVTKTTKVANVSKKGKGKK